MIEVVKPNMCMVLARFSHYMHVNAEAITRKCGNVTVALTIHALIGPQMGSDITSVTDRRTDGHRYLDKVLMFCVTVERVLRNSKKSSSKVKGVSEVPARESPQGFSARSATTAGRIMFVYIYAVGLCSVVVWLCKLSRLGAGLWCARPFVLYVVVLTFVVYLVPFEFAASVQSTSTGRRR